MEAQNYNESSSGFILYRKNNDSAEIEYLLLQSSRNHANWTPPKGFNLIFYVKLF